jgi:Outer membrane protein beta-barrel domain
MSAKPASIDVRRIGSKPEQERNDLNRTKTACAALLLCATAATASAQQLQWTDQAFVNVNFGAQVGSHDFTSTQTFSLYDETANIASSQKIKSGPFFDVGVGYKVWHNVAAGATYSWTSSKSDISIDAGIPDPRVFDSPRAVHTSASGANHTENALHLQATWMMPVTDKIDVGISGGPSIYFVKQDLVTALAVSEPGPTVQSTTVTNESKTTAGFNLGVDVTYLLKQKLMGHQLGVGGLARYTWASAKFAGASDKVTVGGLQLGAGLRVRF